MGKPGENSKEPKAQMLPSNYWGLTPEQQAKWRSELSQTILERARK